MYRAQAPPAAKRRFQLFLIKPSHYDDDGYVIRWWRAIIPSNSLAAVYGIAADCAERQVLRPDVDIEIEAIDETNTRIDIPATARAFSAATAISASSRSSACSRTNIRAPSTLRDPSRQAGIPVAIGGFHVSGCLSMLRRGRRARRLPRDGRRDFRRRGEGRLDIVLQRRGRTARLAPVYDFIKDLPGIEGTPAPFLPSRYVARTLGLSTSFDAGRGCPYQCSFCTIINVQGRKSRFRSADDIEHSSASIGRRASASFSSPTTILRETEHWEAILDRLIRASGKHGIPLGLMIQVDTLCHKIPNFVEKAKQAGVTRVFIGLENINPDNLAAAKKRQNKITEYRKMLFAWKAQGIMTLAGYILGFPADTPESIRRDIAIIQKELPLDIVEFFCLTPLPGSEDHQTLWKNGVPMDPDLNKYDVEHVCAAHPKMSKRMGGDLSGSLVALLFAGSYEDVAASRRGDRLSHGQPGKAVGPICDGGSTRKSASAASRHPSPQASLGTPPGTTA